MAGLNFHREGSGEPLVLVHGLGSSWEIWEPVIPSLAERYDVVAVDLPGFGGSPAPDEAPSIATLTDGVEGLLDELGLGRARVVGNSMGGWVALELARRGRAVSVVAISPAGMGTARENAYASGLVRVLRAMAGPAARIAPTAARSGAGRTLLAGPLFARPWRMRPEYLVTAARRYAEAESFDSMRRWIFSHRAEGLDDVRCPVLIAWGSRDVLLLPRQAQRFVDALPDAELRPLPGLGHAPMSDDPELVASMIGEFAARGSVRSPA